MWNLVLSRNAEFGLDEAGIMSAALLWDDIIQENYSIRQDYI